MNKGKDNTILSYLIYVYPINISYISYEPPRTAAHLAKVAHNMASIHIGQGHDVEEKRFHIVVQCLVIQKELG